MQLSVKYLLRGDDVIAQLYRQVPVDVAARAHHATCATWRAYAERRGAAADGGVATMSVELRLDVLEKDVVPAVVRGQPALIGVTPLTGLAVEGVRVYAAEAARMRRDISALMALPRAQRLPTIAALNAGLRSELNASFYRM